MKSRCYAKVIKKYRLLYLSQERLFRSPSRLRWCKKVGDASDEVIHLKSSVIFRVIQSAEGGAMKAPKVGRGLTETLFVCAFPWSRPTWDFNVRNPSLPSMTLPSCFYREDYSNNRTDQTIVKLLVEILSTRVSWNGRRNLKKLYLLRLMQFVTLPTELGRCPIRHSFSILSRLARLVVKE